jgi:hypothetical protein
VLRGSDQIPVAIIFVLTMQGITEGDDLDVQYAEAEASVRLVRSCSSTFHAGRLRRRVAQA